MRKVRLRDTAGSHSIPLAVTEKKLLGPFLPNPVGAPSRLVQAGLHQQHCLSDLFPLVLASEASSLGVGSGILTPFCNLRAPRGRELDTGPLHLQVLGLKGRFLHSL